MAATLELQNDDGDALTSVNFGTIDGGASQQLQLRVQNVGDAEATSVQLSLARLASNDGLDYAQLAEDIAGNPGAYSTAAINIGTMAPDAYVSFWAKITIPTGTTPAGNPRQVNIRADFTGT